MTELNRRILLGAIAGTTIGAITGNPVRAQSEPTRETGSSGAITGVDTAAGRPLRVIIGFSRHSASDDLMSLIKPDLASALGRPLEIELMPGELGAKAARAAIASPADGSTLLVATFGTHAVNPNLQRDLGYDPIKDFAPVCLATRSPLVLGTRLSLGATTTRELVDLAKRTELTYGSSGVGSAPYLAALLFQKAAGIRMTHRPYSDTRALYEDLEGGHLDLSFNNAASMIPLVRTGQLRALAVTTAERSTALPDTPTVAEAGFEGYALNNWLGFVAPPGTNVDIVSTQSLAIAGILRKASIKKTLAATGIEVVGSTPPEFAAHISAELKRWAWLRPS